MEVKTLDYVSKLKEIEDLNPSFATGMMRICYHGKNRNGWVIPKATLEAAIPTFFNCPIVARYDRKRDKIGAHDVELVTKKGNLALIPATQPVGVVPANNVYFWEKVEEEDGIEHEYLVMPVILWKRQEAVTHIIESQSVDQSMECIFDEIHVDQNGDTVVDKMTMQAFCLLESAKPCFESAAVDVLSSILQEEFSLMKNDWKELCGSENFSINKFQVGEGGLEVMQEDVKKEQIFESEQQNEIVEVHMEVQSGEENSIAEIEAEHDATEKQELADEHEPIDEGEDDVAAETVADEEPSLEAEAAEAGTDAEFTLTEMETKMRSNESKENIKVFASYEQRRQDLECVLPRKSEQDESGSIVYEEYYWLEDFDKEFVYVKRNIWESNPDVVRRSDNGRFGYTFNSEGQVELTSEFEPMVVRWLTVAESVQLDKERAETENLKKWYEQYQKEKMSTLCEEFANLSSVEGYKTIVDAINDGSLDYNAAQEKFFALKGKHVFSLEQHENQKKIISIPVVAAETANSNKGHRYGGLISAR